jgi:hypothetical protein
VFIADTGDNRVVVEKPNGAGGYTQSVVEDTGLDPPSWVAVDGSRDVFIDMSYVVVEKPNGCAATEACSRPGCSRRPHRPTKCPRFRPADRCTPRSSRKSMAAGPSTRISFTAASNPVAFTHPIQGQVGVVTPTTFTWTTTPAATGYQFWVGLDATTATTEPR